MRSVTTGGLRSRLRGVLSATLATVTMILLATSAQAKGVPLPAPDADRGTIAIQLRGRFPPGNKAAATQVHLVRLGEDVDRFAAESVIVSNLSKKKQVYLLNAKPGRYVAVAAQLGGGTGAAYRVFLDKETIGATEVEVVAGEIVFMGELLVDLKTRMSTADEAQSHYARLIAPRPARRGWMARMYTGSYMYPGSLVSVDRGPAAQTEFWTLARDVVFAKDPTWKSAVARELAELGGDEVRVAAAPAPAPEGPIDPSLYREYPTQFSLKLPEGWTAHDQSLASGGALGPFNLIIFSPVDMARLMEPTKDEAEIERMTETMADLNSGKIECFMLNRHAAGNGMECSGFSKRATKRVLAMSSEHAFLQKDAEIIHEPRAERLEVGGCEGLRVFASGRTPQGSEWTLDTRAVADGEILYLFFVRTLTEHFEHNRQTFELALADLRMAAAG